LVCQSTCFGVAPSAKDRFTAEFPAAHDRLLAFYQEVHGRANYVLKNLNMGKERVKSLSFAVNGTSLRLTATYTRDTFPGAEDSQGDTYVYVVTTKRSFRLRK